MVHIDHYWFNLNYTRYVHACITALFRDRLPRANYFPVKIRRGLKRVGTGCSTKMTNQKPSSTVLLPDDARLTLQRWRDASLSGQLPILEEFAPFLLPSASIPFSMVYRRVSERELVYGLVGEELLFLFKANPRGTPVLGYASEADRADRYSIIFRSFEEKRPFWFSGSVLFKTTRLDFGRLGLPMQAKQHQSLLIIYFPRAPLPSPRPTEMVTSRMEELDVFWL